MYFTISEVKNDRAGQLAVLAANELGERMLAGEETAVAFESAIALLDRKLKMNNVAVAAANILAQDIGKRQSAVKHGLIEIVQVLGGEEKMREFFKQLMLPRASIRFEAVGGVRDDVLAAKSRASMLAFRVAAASRLAPNGVAAGTAENEYSEFCKSVYRTLNTSQVAAGVANGVAKEIDSAAAADLPADMKSRIAELQQQAMTVVTKEARERIMARYKGPAPDAGTTPTLH